MKRPKNIRRRELITRAELARRKGCSRSAVTQLCRGALADALVGRRIDANHPSVRQWLAGPDLAPTQSYANLLLEKRQAEVRRLNLQNLETEGRLISRDLVRTHVFGAIDAGNRRLLGDASKTIARRVYGLARSGAPIEEAERTVRELISSQLRFVQTTAVRVLQGGESTKSGDTEPAEAVG